MFDVDCFLFLREEYAPPTVLFFGRAEFGVVVVEGKSLRLGRLTKPSNGKQRIIIDKERFFLSISYRAVDRPLLFERKRLP